MRGETAIPGVPGEEGTIAEILHAVLAERANAAGISEPGNSDPVTDPVRADVAADEIDAADDFMAWNDRILDTWKLRIDDMKVGPANAAGAHADANLSVAGHGVCAFLHLERRPGGRKHHRTHSRFSIERQS